MFDADGDDDMNEEDINFSDDEVKISSGTASPKNNRINREEFQQQKIGTAMLRSSNN